MSFNDKVALVTGATRGIGQAIAMALGKHGATVIGTATSQGGADKISAYLSEAGITGEGKLLNVCEPEAVETVVADITANYAAPAILVNNAGITRDNLFMRMKEEEWDAVIDTDLSSVYRVTKACIRSMIKARWGRIINISSVVGAAGNPGQANYCAAKAGMLGFTKSLAQEIANRGITVNAVAPGFIDTDMTKALNDKQREAIESAIPMKKIGAPDDIANAVLFLSSEETQYITGQTLHVNGGMYMI